MKTIHKVSTAGAFALAAAAIPAVAEVIYYVAPATTYYYTEPATTYYYIEPAPTYYYTTPVYTAPDVVVTAPRYYSDDVRITEDVVGVLASDSRLSGKIGVDTWRNDVTLTGRVSTPGQARIAERDAKSVDGVREVRNQLRTSVGGSP
ncbi:MAG TPA: BON domain-containing protein [Usitatibacter sp.]|nr:BON domain-containing protein [Usitatibacter sp.]